MRRPTRSDPDRHIQNRRPWHRLALGSGVQGRWVQGVAATVAASLLVSGCLITNAATDTLPTGGTTKPGTLPRPVTDVGAAVRQPVRVDVAPLIAAQLDVESNWNPTAVSLADGKLTQTVIGDTAR